MNTHLLALQLMAFQGLLGAFDTLYHHELTEALPNRSTAQKELWIHSARALIYSALFIGLSAWEWHGVWALVLVCVFIVEILLTLWDFVVEDQTRLLPASERVTHTVLAINGGAFITLLLLNFPAWYAQDSAMVWHSFSYLSWFLAACGVGVGLSGVRDGFAAFQLRKNSMNEMVQTELSFSEQSESVLVTGGTGFIGQQLIKALLKNGQRVTLLSRDPKRAAWLFDGQVKCIQTMSELPSHYPIDVIINLAGARILGWRWTQARKAALRRSRIDLTVSVVEWIKTAQVKPRLFLSASAIGYYGVQAQNDSIELTESSPPQAIFMSQLCQEWEAAASTATQYGVLVRRMRFGLVLGQQGALPMMLLPIKLGLGGALGRGTQWLSWIHVQDVINGIAHLWKLSQSSKLSQPSRPPHLPMLQDEAINFTAPETVSQKQFSQIAASILHRPSFFPTPAWPMRLMLGEQADLLVEGQRVIPKRLLDLGFSFAYPQLKTALQAAIGVSKNASKNSSREESRDSSNDSSS